MHACSAQPQVHGGRQPQPCAQCSARKRGNCSRRCRGELSTACTARKPGAPASASAPAVPKRATCSIPGRAATARRGASERYRSAITMTSSCTSGYFNGMKFTLDARSGVNLIRAYSPTRAAHRFADRHHKLHRHRRHPYHRLAARRSGPADRRRPCAAIRACSRRSCCGGAPVQSRRPQRACARPLLSGRWPWR